MADPLVERVAKTMAELLKGSANYAHYYEFEAKVAVTAMGRPTRAEVEAVIAKSYELWNRDGPTEMTCPYYIAAQIERCWPYLLSPDTEEK